MKFPKIFFNDYSIEFGKNENYKEYSTELFQNFLNHPYENIFIKVLDQEEYHNVWKKMLKFLVPIEAAGGLVYNSDYQYLMIFRLGKWDLPKGKIDEGESPDVTALREIEEEVHLPKNLLEIKKFIDFTYHIYLQKNQYMIKTTYWYEIFCKDKHHPLKPQLEEHITEIQWFNKEELLKIDTYPALKNLLEFYFQ